LFNARGMLRTIQICWIMNANGEIVSYDACFCVRVFTGFIYFYLQKLWLFIVLYDVRGNRIHLSWLLSLPTLACVCQCGITTPCGDVQNMLSLIFIVELCTFLSYSFVLCTTVCIYALW